MRWIKQPPEVLITWRRGCLCRYCDILCIFRGAQLRVKKKIIHSSPRYAPLTYITWNLVWWSSSDDHIRLYIYISNFTYSFCSINICRLTHFPYVISTVMCAFALTIINILYWKGYLRDSYLFRKTTSGVIYPLRKMCINFVHKSHQTKRDSTRISVPSQCILFVKLSFLVIWERKFHCFM